MSVVLIITQHLADVIQNTKIEPGGLPHTAADSNALQTIIDIILNIIGALALLMITVSGLRYILAAGDPEKISKAKNGITYGLVGVVIAITAQALVAFVVNHL